MGVKEEVAERFPSLVSLLKQPEIGKLLIKAVSDPKGPWSPGKFQSEFIASHWFRTRSEPERRWWVLSQTDPSEARRQRGILKRSLIEQGRQLGFKVGDKQAKYIAELGMRGGVTDINDPRMLNALNVWAKEAQRRGSLPGGLQSGALKTTARQLREMSAGEFFRPTARVDPWTQKMARDIALGRKTMDDARASLMTNAAKRYPHMAKMIAQGMTPGDIVNPYRELIANELELGNPANVNVMNDPRWRKLLGTRDRKSGKMRMMTESEVLQLARSQDAWWKTSHGREADSSGARGMLQILGIRSG